MEDISKINDTTKPEEYARREKERAAKDLARIQQRASDHMADVQRQMQAGAEREQRIVRIEEKLDKIISILESRA